MRAICDPLALIRDTTENEVNTNVTWLSLIFSVCEPTGLYLVDIWEGPPLPNYDVLSSRTGIPSVSSGRHARSAVTCLPESQRADIKIFLVILS